MTTIIGRQGLKGSDNSYREVVCWEVTGYTPAMIGGFRQKGLKPLFERGDRRRVSPDFVRKIERILARLEEASEVGNMDLPGFRLHPLRGDLACLREAEASLRRRQAGFWSVPVFGNRRLVFRFENGRASDVDLIDYH